MERDTNGRFVKGFVPWNKGKKGLQIPTEETKKKISIAVSKIAKEKWNNDTFRKHRSMKFYVKGRRWVETKCHYCKKIMYVKKKNLRFKKTSFRFCDQKCYHKFAKGENHFNYDKKHPGMNAGIKRPYITGKNNPMFNRERIYYYTAIGFREDLGHKVRSTWEANYCRILKHLKIKYDYEPKHFEFEDGSTYTPDLKIGDIYIEIKGYMNKKSKIVLEKFKRTFPNIRLLIIEEHRFKVLANHYAPLIKNWEYSKQSCVY